MYPGCGGGEVICRHSVILVEAPLVLISWTDLTAILPPDDVVVPIFAPLVVEDLALFDHNSLK